MTGTDSGTGFMGAAIGAIAVLAFILIMVASVWKVFTKAGQPGWAVLVPIYNMIVLLNIVGKPLWWIALFMIPLANFYALFSVGVALAKSFGKGTGFGLGLIFLGVFFFPILGFGQARYIGPPRLTGQVPLAA